jgi:hypothetical protein
MQERRQSPTSCVSSSFNLHAGLSNNTKEVVVISIYRVRLRRRETLNVKEEHLELATKALQEILERYVDWKSFLANLVGAPHIFKRLKMLRDDESLATMSRRLSEKRPA